MNAKNQDMAFVNNTLEEAAEDHLMQNARLMTETDKVDEAQADEAK
jgi:hypothetical protein